MKRVLLYRCYSHTRSRVFVVQLRNRLPEAIGNLLWSAYRPILFGRQSAFG